MLWRCGRRHMWRRGCIVMCICMETCIHGDVYTHIHIYVKCMCVYVKRCVHMHMETCMRISIYIYGGVYMDACVYRSISLYTYIYIYMLNACVYIWRCGCIVICMYTYIYIYMETCTYIYIY